ncbi:MAG TPA: rhodanese-like domain-containing protein [Terriglobales bacterium]|nr:rhodanese-like domain-containing protein [Terriglobales bacterium]
MQEILTISRDELKKRIDEGQHFTLVETLAPEYFAQSHLPGAINLPPDQVKELASTMLPDKKAPIVVYCAKPT